jgi:hypothetical protein
MRRFSIVFALVASLAIAGTVTAAPNKLRTFGTGDVTVTGTRSASIVNGVGEYGGVYVVGKSTYKRTLADVDFSFMSAGAVGGGAPRFSLPIDTNGDKTTDGYAFIDVNSCGGSTLVSTSSATCMVYFNTEPAPYANWDAFAAAHPTWTTSQDIPFVIADAAGSYNVSDIQLN